MKQHDILIVDDEQRYADMLSRRLTLRGCSCAVSYTGLDGIRMMENRDFFLVVLDLRLPDLYGIEVLKRMKTISPKTPVIILTGHGTEKDRVTCLKEGAQDFFHKPLDIEKLMTLLNQLKTSIAQ